MATLISSPVYVPQPRDLGLDSISKPVPQDQIPRDEKSRISPNVIPTENQVIPGDESAGEAGSDGFLALMMLRIMGGQSAADLAPQLLDPKNLTEQEQMDLGRLYAVLVPAPEVDTARNDKLFDQEQPVNRIKFDPTAMSNVAALLSAIAVLVLARAVTAEMQGKFAILAYSAALAQGKATVQQGYAEMMATIGSAIVGVGLAAGGATLAFKGHNARHADIKGNLVEADGLKLKVERDQAIVDRRAPKRAAGDGVNPNAGAKTNTPDADLPVADSSVSGSRQPRNGQAEIDKTQADVNSQQVKVKQAETKLAETKQKLEEYQLDLDKSQAKVRDAEQAHKQNPTEASQAAQAGALAEFKDVTAQHKQATADVAATQKDLKDAEFQHHQAKVEAAKVDVQYRTEDVSAAKAKVDSATRELDGLQKDIDKNDKTIARLENRGASPDAQGTLSDAKAKREQLNQRRSAAETELQTAKAELGQAKQDLIYATKTLTAAQSALQGHIAAASRELAGADPYAEGSPDLTREERAVLMEDIRHNLARINELQIQSKLNMAPIDKLLTSSQMLMAVSNLMSAMMLGMMRSKSFLEQSNAIERGAEAGIQGGMTRAEEQSVGEMTAMINEIQRVLEKIMQADNSVIEQIANARA